MTPARYRTLRKRLGTQAEAAKLLGITSRVIIGREQGKMPIRKEAALAIEALVFGLKRK